MKANKLFLGLFLSLTLLSCKKEADKSTENGGAVTEVKQEVFTITLNAVVAKDDSFQIFYKEKVDDSVPFEDKNSIYAEVKGSDKAQDIVFKLPENVLAQQIRLDYGINKEQSPIKINSFKVKYFDKEINIDGKDFFKHFIFNESTVKIDPQTSTLTPILANGNYDPMCYSEKLLNDKLIELSK